MANNCKNTTTHIAECEHAFIKNGVVEDIYTFTEDAHGSELLTNLKTERGYDDVVCLCDYGAKIHRWSTWDGTTFTEPTLDYLYSIGISSVNQAMADAAAAAAKAAEGTQGVQSTQTVQGTQGVQGTQA